MKYLIASILAGASLACLPAKADSFNNFSEAIVDSGDASARVIASGGQVALGATAIPLSILGNGADFVGDVSNGISNELWTAANAPLTVDEDVVIAVPPPHLEQSYQGEVR